MRLVYDLPVYQIKHVTRLFCVEDYEKCMITLVNGCLAVESETAMEIKKANFMIGSLVGWLNTIALIAVVQDLRLLFENEDWLENESEQLM